MLDRSECITLLNSAFDLPTSPLGIHKYREGYIIDEEKSVRWNREEVQRRNNAYNNEYDRLKYVRNHSLFVAIDTIKCQYILNNLNLPISEIADKIWSKSYENGHSGGASEIFNYIDEYIEFVNDVDKLRRYGEAARTDGDAAGPCPLGIKF